MLKNKKLFNFPIGFPIKRYAIVCVSLAGGRDVDHLAGRGFGQHLLEVSAHLHLLRSEDPLAGGGSGQYLLGVTLTPPTYLVL